MPEFYTYVIGIALFILLICLVVFGVMMQSSTSKTPFPPYADQCPIGWVNTNNGGCKVPFANQPNSGLTNPSFMNAYNLDLAQYKIDNPNAGITDVTSALNDLKNNRTTRIPVMKFNDNVAICDKWAWAKKYNIQWDGISNYNQCS